MEVEGIINHSQAGLWAKYNHLKSQVDYCEQQIDFWSTVQKIHCSEEVQEAIQGVSNIMQMISKSEYMKSILSNSAEDSLKFKGFDFDIIQFYIDLRDSVKDKSTGSLDNA